MEMRVDDFNTLRSGTPIRAAIRAIIVRSMG